MKNTIELSASEYNYIKELWITSKFETVTTKSLTRKRDCFHRTTITSDKSGKLVLEIKNGLTKYWLEK